MKFPESLFALFLCLSLFSCDEFITQKEDPKPPPSLDEIDSDPGCISMTGERFEKYYYMLDESILDDTVSLSSPSVLGFEYDNGYDPPFYGFNQITIHEVPLSFFNGSSSFSSRVTGTVAVGGKSDLSLIAYSAPFDSDATVYSGESGYLKEPYSVRNSFANTPGGLVLPYTGDYSAASSIQEWRVFSLAVSKDFLDSLNLTTAFKARLNPEGELLDFSVYEAFPQGLICTADYYVLLVPVSRSFYQYISLTVSFAGGVKISDIKVSSIIKEHNYDSSSNSITASFNEYDSPYSGPVISYSITGPEGGVLDKTIRIEG